MRLFWSLCVVMLLAGCASIPLSTAMRLSRLDEKTLLQLDPAQVRVRVAIPTGFELDVEQVKLSLAVSNAGQDRREGQFGLRLLSMQPALRNGGLFEGKVPVRAYELMLTSEGIAQLQALQETMRRQAYNQFALSVTTPLAKVPPGARSIRFWTDMRLTAADSYMTLLDGAEIKFTDSQG